MNRTVLGWTLAFVVSIATAAGIVGAARDPRPESIQPRDPAKLSDVDAELILNRVREGDLLAIKGDLASARDRWNAARDKGQGYWPIHEAIGDSLSRHRLEAEADAEYETAGRIAMKQLGRVPPALNLKRAGLLVRLKKPEPALRLLIECAEPDKLAGAMAQIINKSPALLSIVKENAEVRDPRLWGIVAALATEPAERASALGRYVRSVSPADENLAMRAISELKGHKRADEALLVCEAWAKAAPSNPAAYENCGRLLAETGNRGRARLVLSTMVDVKPGDAGVLTRLGTAFRDLGEFPDAIRQFEEALRLRPEEPWPMQEIVVTLLAQGSVEAAMAKYSELKVRKWEPRFGDVGAQFKLKFITECIRLFEEAKRAGRAEDVARLRRLATEMGVPEVGLYDIKIVMTWDAASDVDLDVTEPGGETVNHSHPRSASGAFYPVDNTQGRGPEHYTLRVAPRGKFRVGAHLHGSTPSNVEITVILFEETPRERRITERVELYGRTTSAWPIEFEIP